MGRSGDEVSGPGPRAVERGDEAGGDGGGRTFEAVVDRRAVEPAQQGRLVGGAVRRGLPVDVPLEVGDRLPAEGRGDRAGLDQDDGDAGAGELEAEGVGEALERELRRDVGAAPGGGDEARAPTR